MWRLKMVRLPAISALILFGAVSVASSQEESKPFIQKAEDDYAVYILSAAYHESGYLGVKVHVQRGGKGRIFRVTPGRKYRLKEIKVLGLQSVPLEQIYEGAPVVGEVYSAARVGEWANSLREKYKSMRGTLMHVTQSASFNHEDATVSVTLEFPEGI